MQTDLFIAHVQRACPNLDADIVHRCTLITLDTLCEQLNAGQCKDMASQLPDELAQAVESGGDRADTSGVPITLADFYDKLMFRTELNETDTKTLAQAVARTLSEAISTGEAKDVALELPSELDQLLVE